VLFALQPYQESQEKHEDNLDALVGKELNELLE
jgi:hypothetical protein